MRKNLNPEPFSVMSGLLDSKAVRFGMPLKFSASAKKRSENAGTGRCLRKITDKDSFFALFTYLHTGWFVELHVGESCSVNRTVKLATRWRVPPSSYPRPLPAISKRTPHAATVAVNKQKNRYSRRLPSPWGQREHNPFLDRVAEKRRGFLKPDVVKSCGEFFG